MSEQEQQYRRRQWETFTTFGTVSLQDVDSQASAAPLLRPSTLRI